MRVITEEKQNLKEKNKKIQKENWLMLIKW